MMMMKKKLAACQPKSLKRLNTFAVSLDRLSKDLSEELAHGLGGRASLRSSLRLRSKLVGGLWLLYRRKCKALREYADKTLQLLDQRNKMGLHLKEKKGRKKSAAAEDAVEGNSRFGNVPHNDDTPESEVVERLAQAAGEWTAVPLPEGEGNLPQVPTGDVLQADRSAITLREDVSSVRFEEEMNLENLPPEDANELQELEQLLERLSGSSTSLGAEPPAGETLENTPGHAPPSSVSSGVAAISQWCHLSGSN
ncbi:hypothetical protein HPB47_011433 [Ixodes persulcatus]|uniref:Uncharacterized protein n=1 Tax=Ixodes persulcatus TaxID=34615 RepID=A0AC60NWA6_IXOPE|nr:hypothetical protein HPB47_011433 [Ixodes persulcatus]